MLESLYVFVHVGINAEGELMKFAEFVAVNRAIPVRNFSTFAEARQRLTDMD